MVIFQCWSDTVKAEVPYIITDKPAAVLDIETGAVYFIGQLESGYGENGERIVGAEEKLYNIQNKMITKGVPEKAKDLKLVKLPATQYVIEECERNPKAVVMAAYEDENSW